MRVLITRPAGDGEVFAAKLAQRGVECLMAPVMTIRFLDGVVLELDGVQAVLVTSANGVRALARLTECRDVSLVAVGPSTAGEARDMGFRSVRSAGGDVGRLAELVQAELDPAGSRLVHIAGSAVAGDLQGRLGQAGFTVERVVAYRADSVDALPDAVCTAMADGCLDGAVFFSARTASLFVKLAVAAGVHERLADLAAYCLSEAVAAALADAGFERVLVAKEPTGDGLLDLICSDVTD